MKIADYDLSSIDSFLKSLLEHLPKQESIDFSAISSFYECSSFQHVLSVIEKFHSKSLKSLGIFTEILYDCDSIDILRKFINLTTVKTEDFTLNFDTHDQLLNFIENRDFEFKTIYPHLQHYISSDEEDIVMNVKYITHKNK